MPQPQQRYRERPSRLPGAVVWTWDAPDRPLSEPRSVLPDGCMDLIWSDGRIVVAGPDTHAFEVEPQNRASCAAIRCAPGTAPVLLGVPAYELRDHRAELADLWPPAAVRRLTERIDEAPDPAAALERFALDRITDTGPPDPRTVAVAEGLRRGRSVAATAAEAGLGARQLHRRSLAAFGYGPKTLARVLRLQRALELIRTGLPYADAACAAGCTDQAHLAREMRDLAGTTLGAYFAAANSETPLPSGSSTTA
ncbi:MULTISPECIES: AraC family transcriptional regulator [Streptomyces]|uniref:helix-turn-helix domain-containing protein n=1 Tax=Streptomyces TaxID=1883 RepID=UPI000D50C4F8|nr:MULTISPECIES: helix-turn-helix domain-containing protein [Streptomyces]MXG28887.1 helix-turn-helix domain-containing protein [Streptomyces sp. YIM 132580]PVC78116.1 transcriptional regulator [Streptomyces sp. CS065A]